MKCPTCDGKGAFNTWDRACIPSNIHYKARCHTCEGRGILGDQRNRDDDENRIQDLEFRVQALENRMNRR